MGLVTGVTSWTAGCPLRVLRCGQRVRIDLPKVKDSDTWNLESPCTVLYKVPARKSYDRIRGTSHGRFEPKYLQNYLDEYVFRFNCRKSKDIEKRFMRIVQQVAAYFANKKPQF